MCTRVMRKLVCQIGLMGTRRTLGSSHGLSSGWRNHEGISMPPVQIDVTLSICQPMVPLASGSTNVRSKANVRIGQPVRTTTI